MSRILGACQLSFTTKFLWLKFKHPVIIYDSQARKAVGLNSTDDLAIYYKNWYASFNENKALIVQACSKLADQHLYSVDQLIGTQEYIQSISSQLWFHERVHDIYLWNKGNNV